MAVFKVTATIELTFDSRDGLVDNEDAAREEMFEYLQSGPSWQEFDVDVIVERSNVIPECFVLREEYTCVYGCGYSTRHSLELESHYQGCEGA